jgi:hypothetical protein
VRLRRLIAVISLVMCVGASVAESLDRWDATAFGDDTEGHFVIVAICAGLALCAAGALTALIRASASGSVPSERVHSDLRINLFTLAALPGRTSSSPPLTLRI